MHSRGDVKTDADHTLHLSDLANTSHGKAKRQLLGNIESNKSSSSSGGFAFADSKVGNCKVRIKEIVACVIGKD